MKKTQELVKNLTEELLAKLTITASVAVSEVDGALRVQIETEEGGILIGHHGRSLEAIQILLGQMVYKKLGTWMRIVVSVGDYRERREKQLQELAQNTAAQVTQTHEAVVIPDLTPAERRIIHMILAEHPEVMSLSEGEGRDRKLVVKLREANK